VSAVHCGRFGVCVTQFVDRMQDGFLDARRNLVAVQRCNQADSIQISLIEVEVSGNAMRLRDQQVERAFGALLGTGALAEHGAQRVERHLCR
jgi:hypothetical protein